MFVVAGVVLGEQDVINMGSGCFFLCCWHYYIFHCILDLCLRLENYLTKPTMGQYYFISNNLKFDLQLLFFIIMLFRKKINSQFFRETRECFFLFENSCHFQSPFLQEIKILWRRKSIFLIIVNLLKISIASELFCFVTYEMIIYFSSF